MPADALKHVPAKCHIPHGYLTSQTSTAVRLNNDGAHARHHKGPSFKNEKILGLTYSFPSLGNQHLDWLRYEGLSDAAKQCPSICLES